MQSPQNQTNLGTAWDFHNSIRARLADAKYKSWTQGLNAGQILTAMCRNIEEETVSYHPSTVATRIASFRHRLPIMAEGCTPAKIAELANALAEQECRDRKALHAARLRAFGRWWPVYMGGLPLLTRVAKDAVKESYNGDVARAMGHVAVRAGDCGTLAHHGGTCKRSEYLGLDAGL